MKEGRVTLAIATNFDWSLEIFAHGVSALQWKYVIHMPFATNENELQNSRVLVL